MGRASQKFDQQLFTLKLSELSDEMQSKSVASDKKASAASRATGGSLLPNIVNGQLALLGEWLKGVDLIARGVWQTQGEPITPDFVRDVLVPKAMTLIAIRDSVIKSSVGLVATRTRLKNQYVALRHLAMKIRKLKGEVANRYEIEVRELEYRNAPTAPEEEKKSKQGSEADGTKPEPSTERANQSVLSPGFFGASDPVDGNPFPPNNPRHEIWKQATLKAEEEACRLNSQAMRNRPTAEGLAAWMERGGGLREFVKWVLKLHVTRFDIWAERTCQVVWDENDLGAYDSWLHTYAQNYLGLMADSGTVRTWPTGTCPIPAEFQPMLIERVNHWKAEARRFLRAYRAELKKLTEHAQQPSQQSELGNGADRLTTGANQTESPSAEKSDKTAQNEQPSYQQQVEKYSRWNDTELALRFGKAGQYVKELCATEEKLRGNWSRRSETALELREKREKLIQILLRDLKLMESPHQGAVVEFRDVLAAGVGRNDTEGVGEPIPAQNNGKTTQSAESKSTKAAPGPPPEDEKIKQFNAEADFGDVLAAGIGGRRGGWTSVALGGVKRPADRRSAVDAYIQEVLEKTGSKITRAAFWRAAGYKTRTEFERWQRCDAKHKNKAADKNFTRTLTEKPHLK